MTRRLTEAEREAVRRLCFRGRLGRLTEYEAKRCAELHAINPAEYSELAASARSDADKTVNPRGDR